MDTCQTGKGANSQHADVIDVTLMMTWLVVGRGDSSIVLNSVLIIPVAPIAAVGTPNLPVTQIASQAAQSGVDWVCRLDDSVLGLLLPSLPKRPKPSDLAGLRASDQDG